MNWQLYIQRRENKLEQKELAEMLNMHKTTYCLKENGKRDFTLTECRTLAEIFDTTLDGLFASK